MVEVGRQDAAPSILRALAVRTLTWFPEYGVGHFPVKASLDTYGEAYFAKYREYAATEMGRRITAARLALVNRHWGGPLIDIGIGCGDFLSARVATYGYDINLTAVEWLHAKDLWWNPYQRPCRAASMWDVLEHIDDFPRLLEQVHDYLFVSLPVFTGPDHVLASKHYRKDEHYWYFTEAGFTRLMSGLGWKCLEKNDDETKLGRDGIGSFAFGRSS